MTKEWQKLPSYSRRSLTVWMRKRKTINTPTKPFILIRLLKTPFDSSCLSHGRRSLLLVTWPALYGIGQTSKKQVKKTESFLSFFYFFDNNKSERGGFLMEDIIEKIKEYKLFFSTPQLSDFTWSVLSSTSVGTSTIPDLSDFPINFEQRKDICF